MQVNGYDIRFDNNVEKQLNRFKNLTEWDIENIVYNHLQLNDNDEEIDIEFSNELFGLPSSYNSMLYDKDHDVTISCEINNRNNIIIKSN